LPPDLIRGLRVNGSARSAPDDRLREREGVTTTPPLAPRLEAVHPTPPAFAPLRRATLPLQGRVSDIILAMRLSIRAMGRHGHGTLRLVTTGL